MSLAANFAVVEMSEREGSPAHLAHAQAFALWNSYLDEALLSPCAVSPVFPSWDHGKQNLAM